MSIPSPAVFEATDADFDQSVVQASHSLPVLVDFWADWCQPCKMLMPVLGKVVDQLAGQVRLAKVNTDEQQQLAMRMGIRSLPTVRLYVAGKVVGEFMGAQPEQAVRAFLAEHLPAPADAAGDAAREAFDGGDLESAERIVRASLAQSPGDPGLIVNLASVLLATGRADEAEAALEQLPADVDENDDLRRLRGQVQFAGRATGIDDVAALETRLHDPDSSDDASLHEGAALRVAQGRFDEALGLLLRLLTRNRSYGEDAARRDMLTVFEILGSDSPLVRDYRRRMAATLF